MKAIKGYEGLYSASSGGGIYSHRSNRFLKPSQMKNGYWSLTLYKSGEEKTFLVHRLVALSWLKNTEDKPCVNHIDRDRSNNKLSNLEWVTYSENNEHSFKFYPKGYFRKYDDDFVNMIFKYTMDGWRPVDIASSLGCVVGTVTHILYNDDYDDIKSEYDFDNRPRRCRALSDEKVIKVCQLLQEGGHTIQQIADKTGASRGSVSNIKQRKSHTLLSNSFDF